MILHLQILVKNCVSIKSIEKQKFQKQKDKIIVGLINKQEKKYKIKS